MQLDGEHLAPPAVVLVTTADSAFGLPALSALASLHEAGKIRLVAVIDAATPAYASLKARSRRLCLSLLRDRALPRSVTAQCARLGISRFVPPEHDLNSAATVSFLRRSGVKYAIVFGCDRILRPSLLREGVRFVNYHNSFLPEYRGVGATAWPLLDGAKETGFSFHTIEDETIDEGLLVLQERVAISERMSSEELGALLNRKAAAAIPKVIELLQAKAKLSPLPKGGAYYTRKMVAALRMVSLDEAPLDIAHRARVLGQVELAFNAPRLRLQDISIDEPGPKPTSSLRIPVQGGSIRVGRINYLPAVAFVPFVWAAIYRHRRYDSTAHSLAAEPLQSRPDE